LICLFGGTFDPVHLGHLHAALSVCEAFSLERVNLLLSARPGHRAPPVATMAHRWRMLEIACEQDPRLCADDREVRRAVRLARPSYTVETLEEIRRDAPTEPILWVVGSDAYQDLLGWHRWEAIFELAHLVVLQRPGEPLVLPALLAAVTQARRAAGRPAGPAGDVLFLDLPMRPISATAVRAALAAGETTDDLLPVAVYTYISEHNLYGVRSVPGSIA